MNNAFTKGKANQDTLADRMKRYEATTTNSSLMERLPIYARIDMRAGHTFCKSFKSSFDKDYSDAMNYATSYLVEKTGALVGYTQSDEASFVWLDHTKLPFETRLFKLQSVFASMFTAAFIKFGMSNGLAEVIEKHLPSFDCRIMNMPSLDECANMIIWREKDSIKNSITLLALEHFSNCQIHKKNSQDKIRMLKDEKNIDYYTELTEQQRNGTYFRRELYDKVLTDEEIAKIPKEKLPPSNCEDGTIVVKRSHVVKFSLGVPAYKLKNKVNALFFKETPAYDVAT